MITKSSRDLAENVCLTCKLSGAETCGLLCPALRTRIMKVLGRSFFWVLFPVLPWAVQAVEHEEVAQRVIKLHRGRGVAATQSRQWVRDSCRKLSGLLRQKNAVLNKLKNAIGAVEKDVGLSDEEKLFQVHTFEIFQKELNESENSVFQAIYGLQRALQGDYRDVVNMKESSRQRLEALREAAIKEETEYMELLAAEKHQVEALKNMQHQNQSLSMLDEILEDVRKAADRLEEEIEEHAFDDNKSVKGVNFEAVLRVEEEEANSKQNITKREVEDDLGLSMLIDSQNNQYILTKPRDSTIPRADHHFIKDIVTIGMLSLPCGWLCTAIGLPTMFGYIICGVLLGPSGLNSIKSIVQVETLGEFGVFFTLFLVGLEFSPEKLRKVTELLDVSMELGCFLAGALISSQGPVVTEIATSIEPIRDFLAIVFFASIGLHVFPTFVAYELTVLVFLTLSVVVMKFLLAALVLSLILPRSSQYIKWIVSAGLAQVSEFSFVLGSRARRAGVISREVYLLILSVTTLSLLLAPVLWRAAISRCVPRPERRSSL
nr:transmembrane and coiled-coil domain-containing protein 3 isoform X7 [Pongo pygmaeus]